MMKLNRRNFLKGSAAALGAISLPTIAAPKLKATAEVPRDLGERETFGSPS